jgi:hypothetical protein
MKREELNNRENPWKEKCLTTFSTKKKEFKEGKLISEEIS